MKTEELTAIVGNYLDAEKATRNHQAHLLDMLKSHHLLHEGLRALSEMATENFGVTESAPILNVVHSAETQLHASIIEQLGYDPLLARPTVISGKTAMRIFNISELAEAIFCHLPFLDLIRAAQVNKTFANTIDTSPKTQLTLGLLANPASFWTSVTPAFEVHRIDKIMNAQGLHMDILPPGLFGHQDASSACVHIYLDIYLEQAIGRTLPPAASRGRSMLICQPPIREMGAIPKCCGNIAGVGQGMLVPGLRFPKPKAIKMSSETGLTLGDLVDAAQKISQEHRSCPYALSGMHNPDSGFVRAVISFYGKLALQANDPVLLRLSGGSGLSTPDQEEVDSGNLAEEQAELEMTEFIKAKQEGELLTLRQQQVQR